MRAGNLYKPKPAKKRKPKADKPQPATRDMQPAARKPGYTTR
jgi:hypothetical protein